MIEDREIQAPDILTLESEHRTIEATESIETTEIRGTTASRANRSALARQKAYDADLMKAHTALMEREVILPRQPDLFRLIHRHYYTLQTWHDQHTGWRISRNPNVIRLVRQVSATTPGYLYDRLKDPGDFACLTWILWYAENRQLSGRGIDQQFLLSQLAEQIQLQSASESEDGRESGRLDFRRPADRYAIQRALNYLQDLGGIQLVDGQTKEWVEQTAGADVLYEFTDVIRSLIVAFNPQMIAAIAPRLNDSTLTLKPTLLPGADTTSGLTRAWRALLLGPALFRYDDPTAFAELLTHADGVANELIETFGWLLEVNRDYTCIVRASGMSGGPVTGLIPFATNDQIALLLCQAIRKQVESGVWPGPDEYGCLHVTAEDLTALSYALREQFGENWGSEARNKSSRSLLNEVYKKMRQVGLLRGPDEAGNILILPTAARYSAAYDTSAAETLRSKTRSKARAKVVTVESDELWSATPGADA